MNDILKGKTAVVTGGARGIGAAICKHLASMGADIAICARKADERTAQLEKEITETCGVTAKTYACDVADAEQCKAAVKQILADFGNITVLVNNAGITRDGLILTMKEEDFDAVINTNLKGCYHMIQACYRPFMKQKYGKIINLSSVSGLLGTAGQANYAASKAGVIALTKVTARELASRNVTCNAIAPGFISTDMTKGLEDQYIDQIPMKRVGTPEDVAKVAGFLASPDSDYLTGEVIRIDGGLAIG